MEELELGTFCPNCGTSYTEVAPQKLGKGFHDFPSKILQITKCNNCRFIHCWDPRALTPVTG